MEQSILNGVGKKMRIDYLNGRVSEKAILAMYRRNKEEADSFSLFGYRENDIRRAANETHNPLLRMKFLAALEERKLRNIKSTNQNIVSLSKLENHKKSACGMGLRKLIKHLDAMSRVGDNTELRLLKMLLETEFANLSAKQHSGKEKSLIYERKDILLYQMSELLDELGWRYGINDATGKNACYLVYVYLPNGVQLTWHSNDLYIYEYYPLIDVEWDGQVCMTMDKILDYINTNYICLPQVA